MRNDQLSQLEKRLKRVEEELRAFHARLGGSERSRLGWKAIVGTHEGSEMFDRIVRRIERLRQEDYAQARIESSESRTRTRRGGKRRPIATPK